VVCRPGSGKSQIHRLMAEAFLPALGKRAVTSGTVAALLQTMKRNSEVDGGNTGGGSAAADKSGVTGATLACIIPEFNGYGAL
jgi:3-deoxy-D-arabino-heptulosonate 7-phosphate (DAHP) synthase